MIKALIELYGARIIAKDIVFLHETQTSRPGCPPVSDTYLYHPTERLQHYEIFLNSIPMFFQLPILLKQFYKFNWNIFEFFGGAKRMRLRIMAFFLRWFSREMQCKAEYWMK